MEGNDLGQLTDGLIDPIINTELFQEQGSLYMDEDDENEPDDVIIVHMDIREPLRTLQYLLEQKVGVNLKTYSFWLQDAQELEPHKNLVDQCVKGEGLVQINVQIQTISQRINIVDVLKPTDAALAALALENNDYETINVNNDNKDKFNADESQDSTSDQDHSSARLETEKPCLDWVLDSKFKKEQMRLKIPEDPNDWTVAQVKHWLQWAIKQFELTRVVMSDWVMTGKELCSLTHSEFRNKVVSDPGNVFWTHLQLLKECKFVSVVHKAVEQGITSSSSVIGASGKTGQLPGGGANLEMRIMRKSALNSIKTQTSPSASIINVPESANQNTGNVVHSPWTSGNNGQVQLWQFLLEILTDREHAGVIQWVGTEGEFKLTDPERVARLWGEKKNKPAMNYEKLSRALRYYYDGDMISKVSGKRFAYKFDCDLKLLIGYDALELSQLVNAQPYSDESIYLEHLNSKSDEE